VLYPVIVLLLAAGITILMLQKSYIPIEYVRNGIDDNAVISLFTLGGLIKYKYDVPIINFSEKGLTSRLIKRKGRKEKAESSEKKQFGLKEFIERYVYIVELKKHYEKTLSYLQKKLKTKEFDLDMDIGTNDPFNTAIFTGIAWSAAGILTSCLIDKRNEAKKKVRIKSNFVENNVKVDLYCIFSIKIVHIIVVIFKLLLGILKGKLFSKK
jgi:hypothetical protein